MSSVLTLHTSWLQGQFGCCTKHNWRCPAGLQRRPGNICPVSSDCGILINCCVSSLQSPSSNIWCCFKQDILVVLWQMNHQQRMASCQTPTRSHLRVNVQLDQVGVECSLAGNKQSISGKPGTLELLQHMNLQHMILVLGTHDLSHTPCCSPLTLYAR